MSQSRSKKSNPLKPPEIKRVESPILKNNKYGPGGPHTPGAKKKRAEEEAKKKK